MTRREEVAAIVLAALVSRQADDETFADLAEDAIAAADELLARLDRRPRRSSDAPEGPPIAIHGAD